MAMHEHQHEAILDLRNDPVITQAEIETRLDGCEQCLTDLAEQQSIASYLADLDPPSLTGPERAMLRSAVLAEIESAEVIPLAPPRGWDWTRLGTVAAALVGVVAVAGIFSMVGGDTDEASDGGDTVAASELADADDAALAFEAVPSAELPGSDAADESAEDLGGAALAAPSDLVVDLGAVDRAEFATGLDDVRRSVVEMTESSGVLQRAADQVELSCLDRLSNAGSIRAIVTAVVDGLEVEVYLDGGGEEFGYVSMDCSSYDVP